MEDNVNICKVSKSAFRKHPFWNRIRTIAEEHASGSKHGVPRADDMSKVFVLL